MDKYTIAVGKSRLDTDWRNIEATWEQLMKKCLLPVNTAETVAEYRNMTKVQRGRVKDVGGFVGGRLSGPRRKEAAVLARTLVTLDIDYGTRDTPEAVKTALGKTLWLLYSTHSHTPETPRYRLVIPLSREVSPDEYLPIARRIAERIGIDTVDPSTYQAARLMYWPSCSRDARDVTLRHGGELPLDADAVLGSYLNWQDVTEWPSSTQEKAVTTRHGNKQEDPTAKPGIIGAFCRTYSISQAIDKFLSDCYVSAGSPGRYTYLKGTTTGGAIAYEDKWLYSHHGTDPCCEREVNAFDLVRLHKFAQLDEENDPDTPVNRLPSFLEMTKFAESDRDVTALLNRERLGEAVEAFEGVDIEDPEKKSWLGLLKTDKRGLVATPANYCLLLRNDPRLKGAVRYDCFHDRLVLQRDLPWRAKRSNPFWCNSDDASLCEYVSTTYFPGGNSPITKGVLLDACESVFHRDTFHPVRDYLQPLQWDGRPRLDTLLIDYLGAADTPLNRVMCRKHFTAAVARIFEPGIKYDQMLTLVGPEGIGKSTLIRRLGGEWFDDSFSSENVGSKDSMEQLRGRWLIEMGELKDYRKGTVEAFKSFLAKQFDKYRPAYGRVTEIYMRQCVFFATTNEGHFLKGDTGNRRFWVVEVGGEIPMKDVFHISDDEVAQIWAEAVTRYKEGESLILDAELEGQARKIQADFNEIAVDDRIGIIESCLKKKLPDGWYSMSIEARKRFFQAGAELEEGVPSIHRETICAAEVMAEFLNQPIDKYRSREISQILRGICNCDAVVCRSKDSVYGLQRRYQIPPDFYSEND